MRPPRWTHSRAWVSRQVSAHEASRSKRGRHEPRRDSRRRKTVARNQDATADEARSASATAASSMNARNIPVAKRRTWARANRSCVARLCTRRRAIGRESTRLRSAPPGVLPSHSAVGPRVPIPSVNAVPDEASCDPMAAAILYVDKPDDFGADLRRHDVSVLRRMGLSVLDDACNVFIRQERHLQATPSQFRRSGADSEGS